MHNDFNLTNILAAIAGSVVGLRAFPGESNSQKAWNLVCGFFTAVFVGPAVAIRLNITEPRLFACAVFAVGVGGLVFIGALVDGVRQTKVAAIITSWLSRRETP